MIRKGLKALASLSPPIGGDVKATAAEAAFNLAESKRRRYEGVQLALPKDRLARQLPEKTRALLQARDEYVAAIQYKEATWAANAAVRIGQLYEHFVDALEILPQPEDLTPGAMAHYQSEMQRRLNPLRHQAFQAYTQVLLLSERVGVESEYVDMARVRVSVLEPLLAAQVLASPRSSEIVEGDEPQEILEDNLE